MITVVLVLKACTNGSSELVNNISMSVVGMLYNIQLLKFAGENGVAAYGVMMYFSFFFSSTFSSSLGPLRVSLEPRMS